jgi:hypothetical protein
MLAVLLLIVSCVYLSLLPPNLQAADESFFLYEAKRISDGEIMYRDVFDFITPLSIYAMALCFWVFGPTMETARLATAVGHGACIAILYLICRRIGVRREIAILVPVGYLAICQPAWPFASPHWFSTQVAVFLLAALVEEGWARRPRQAIVLGVITGILVGSQQQRGVVMALGVGTLLVAYQLLGRRFEPTGFWSSLWVRLSYFALGVSLVVVLVMTISVALAGGEAVYDALVRFPLESYSTVMGVRWGDSGPLSGAYAQQTFPNLLRFAPLVIPVLLVRALWRLYSGRGRDELRRLTVLILFSVFSALSVWYYPDVIHIAFIAPAFLVCAAELMEWSLTNAIHPPRLARACGWILAVVILVAAVPHLSANVVAARNQFPILHDTEFGTVAFSHRWQPILIDKVRALLDDSPSGDLFCYANVTSPYLMTGGHNPTPFQFFQAFVSPDHHTRRVLSILRERSVPYILGSPFFMRPDDPVVQYIRENYDFVDIPAMDGVDEIPTLWLYGRIDRPDGFREGADGG